MVQNDSSSSRGPAWLAIVWPLLTGLAVGFLVGREVGNRGSGGSGESAAVTGKAPAGTKMPAKVYKSENEFPEGWTKSADLASVTTVSLADLTAAQKVTVMQALNERDCECGCGMGKIAGCIKKDPELPAQPEPGARRHRPGEAGQGPRRDPRGDRRQAEAVGRIAVQAVRAHRGRLEEGRSVRARTCAAAPPRPR
jgi:hypothetical protein